MTDQVTTKTELLADIERAWTALDQVLARLTVAQMTTLRDAQGWTVKDHIIHLAAWERSVVFFLQGKPRHAGLGVDESLYLNGSADDVNAVVFQQHRDLPLSDAQADFRDVHATLLKLLQPLTDDDLLKSYRQYLPDEPGEGEGPRALELVYGDTAGHVDTHLPWIKALVGETS